MLKNVVRAACAGVFVGLFVLASAFPANAVPLADNYSGGTNYYGSPDLDVIQDSNTNVFQITGANVSRPDTHTLVVQINTYFAGVPGNVNPNIAALADGTTYGSLFLTPLSNWSPAGTAGNHFSTDNMLTTGSTWTSAVTTTNPGLYAIGAYSSGHPSSQNASVPDYYTTANGTIVTSNVGGNPVSQPNGGAPPFFFRQSQGVQYTPGTNQSSLGSVSVAITPTTFSFNSPGNPNTSSLVSDFGVLEGSITYTITDDGTLFSQLGNSFALAWAMTCANDVIQGYVTFPPGETPPGTPLPAALPLFVSGLGILGFLGRRRKKQMAQMVATAA